MTTGSIGDRVGSDIPGDGADTAGVDADTAGIPLLWLPYILLTIFLMALLIASFIHFHYKYRDRYARRDELAKELHRTGDPHAVKCTTNMHMESGTSFNNRPISLSAMHLMHAHDRQKTSHKQRTKPRLGMLYDNTVDVSSVVENSLLDKDLIQMNSLTNSYEQEANSLPSDASANSNNESKYL